MDICNAQKLVNLSSEWLSGWKEGKCFYLEINMAIVLASYINVLGMISSCCVSSKL